MSEDLILEWISEWVDTGEDRINDDQADGDPDEWEVYAGWLRVEQMPARVRQFLDPDGSRWPELIMDSADTTGDGS